ncbi:hypothetical protein M758_3G224300 [Ceratodon purpureus]|nr:hypothetical protein M758_3G224300 [Ceratodon purpureus]
MVGSNVLRYFQTFMARVIALEDMAKMSSQMLVVFQQELVLASEPSERLNAYQEAGYRHCHTDHAGLVKLDNAHKFLQNHVQQARAIVEEIQRLLEEANGIMHEELSAKLGNVAFAEGLESSETAQVADGGQGVSFAQAGDTRLIKVRHLSTPDYVTTMAAIYGMVQQDFTMQVSHNHWLLDTSFSNSLFHLQQSLPQCSCSWIVICYSAGCFTLPNHGWKSYHDDTMIYYQDVGCFEHKYQDLRLGG